MLLLFGGIELVAPDPVYASVEPGTRYGVASDVALLLGNDSSTYSLTGSIYYTLDGSTPTQFSQSVTEYQPIVIPTDAVTTVKAFSVSSSNSESQVYEFVYNLHSDLLLVTEPAATECAVVSQPSCVVTCESVRLTVEVIY